MKKIKLFFLLTVALTLSASCASSDGIQSQWQRVPMNDAYDVAGKGEAVQQIIDRYAPTIAPLMEIVAYAAEEITEQRPESGLSNLAADIILSAVQPYVKPSDRVISLTNFGGIRAPFPKGGIRIYDVYSTFPFDNTLVVADVKGSDIRAMLERFCSWHFEALGGVRLVVQDEKLVSCEIGGKPLDDHFIYKLATVDFLINGGDNLFIGKKALKIQETGIFMRDAVVTYLKQKTAEKHIFNNQIDNRITISKSK